MPTRRSWCGAAARRCRAWRASIAAWPRSAATGATCSGERPLRARAGICGARADAARSRHAVPLQQRAAARLKAVYDRFFENGGYRFESQRDQVNTREVDRHTRDFLGDVTGLRLLDIACGEGRVPGLAEGCAAVVGVDLSEVAIRTCRRRYAARPNISSR